MSFFTCVVLPYGRFWEFVCFVIDVVRGRGCVKSLPGCSAGSGGVSKGSGGGVLTLGGNEVDDDDGDGGGVKKSD